MSVRQDFDSKLTNALLRKRDKKFRLPNILLVFFILLLISDDIFAADCVVHRGGYFHETYNAELKYYTFEGADLSACVDVVLMTGLEYNQLKTQADMVGDLQPIDAASIAESFTWGFGTYIGFWFLGYTIKNARMVIRKA